MSTIAARLERIPFGRFHARLLLMGGLGFMFESLDALIVGFIMPVIRVKWNLSSFETGVLGSSTYVGVLIGALLAGIVGDRFGRKVVMMWALAFFCVMAIANAFVNSWEWFIVFRALGGIGIGGEVAIIAPYLSEFVSRKYRGMFTGALTAFISLGFVLAATISYLVIPTGPEGWRYVLLIASAPVLILLWWRKSLVESPRWLESQGREKEADIIVSKIERDLLDRGIHLPPYREEPAYNASAARSHSPLAKLRMLWSKPLAKTTATIWILWFVTIFCSYAFNVWIPSLLVDKGMTITKSFGFSMAIYTAMFPGYLAGAFCNEKFGRKPTIVCFLVLAVFSAAALSLAGTNASVVLFSIALSFTLNGAVAGQYAYTPEVFPTDIRATGAGAASAFSRIGAIAAPMVVGFLYPIAGFAGVFGLATGLLIIAAITVMLFGIETRGLSLESISQAEMSRDEGDEANHANRERTPPVERARL